MMTGTCKSYVFFNGRETWKEELVFDIYQTVLCHNPHDGKNNFYIRGGAQAGPKNVYKSTMKEKA